jgi:hypothetical protein
VGISYPHYRSSARCESDGNTLSEKFVLLTVR